MRMELNFVDRPKDLRERLNRIRAEKAEIISKKICNEFIKLSYPVKGRENRILREETASDSGFETSVDESREVRAVLKVSKLRPDSRVSLSDAIKISLGLQSRARRTEIIHQSTRSFDIKEEFIRNGEREEKVSCQTFDTIISELKNFEPDRNISITEVKLEETKHEVVEEVPLKIESLDLLKTYVLRPEASPFKPIVSQPTESGPSKLQCRLDRIRGVQSSKTEDVTTKNEPITAAYSTQMQTIVEEIKCCEGTSKLSVKTDSTFTQSQLDSIGRQALLKLTEDQRFSIQYISTVSPPKHFMECYDYFIEYNVEIQGLPLDFVAVDAYLKSRGIILEELKHHQRLMFR